MYSRPNLLIPEDRLAHILSELHNESAPIGWERYRFLASLLLAKLPIKPFVKDERFLDHQWQAGLKPTESSVLIMNSLTDEQRLEVMSNFCKHCGCKDPGCKCWRDD